MPIGRIGSVLALVIVLSLSAAAQENPAAAGMSTERLERLDAVVARAIAENDVAGAVVLVRRNGHVARHRAYGVANVDTGRPMRIDDIFRIASMTKAITSAAVMILYEDGLLLLDDPVGDYLPSFDKTFDVIEYGAAGDGYSLVPARGPVTIRQLLTHTSGLSYRFMGLEPLTSMYIDADISDGIAGEALTLEAFVRTLGDLPLAHQPGERWTYGLSTDVLGRLVEVVSGQGLDDFLAERLFGPLQMTETWFELPPDIRDRMPAVHRERNDGGLEVVPPGTIDDGPVRFSIDYPYDGIVAFPSGGGGLSSTAADYGRFLQMILNGGTLDGTRILGRMTVELMTSNQVGHLPEAAFGAAGFTLGFSLSGGPESGSIMSRGTLGWGGFFNTLMWVDPAENLVAVLMTQHYPYGVDLLRRFPVMVYQAIDD